MSRKTRTWIMKSVSRISSAGLGRMCGSWCQQRVMSLRSGSGQSGSIHGRSPLTATCREHKVTSGGIKVDLQADRDH